MLRANSPIAAACHAGSRMMSSQLIRLVPVVDCWRVTSASSTAVRGWRLHVARAPCMVGGAVPHSAEQLCSLLGLRLQLR